MFKCSDLFLIEEDGLYMLCQSDTETFVFIGLDNGNRWSEPVHFPGASPNAVPGQVVAQLLAGARYVRVPVVAGYRMLNRLIESAYKAVEVR